MSEPSVYVVDDDPQTRAMVADYLALNGYCVRALEDAAELRKTLCEAHPDLIVLDLNMPGEDGLSLVRFLKSETDIPVVMLTATASLVDRVVGLELGADDYIAKPCELRELLARIRAVTRRSTARNAAARVAPSPEPAQDLVRREIRFGTKWLDLDAQILRDDHGAEVQLVQSEFSLLRAFAENPRRVLTRERLLDLASARDGEPFDRAIDVRITRIRKKVEPDPANPKVIRTVRGAGYLFSPDSTPIG